MAISDKTELQSQIATLFPDNISGSISAQDLRTHLLDALDSQQIQRQANINTSAVNINITAAAIDQNNFYVLTPAPTVDQSLTLPAITADLIGRNITLFLDYSDQQLTVVPDGSDTIVGRSTQPANETLLIIRCLDAARWLVSGATVGSVGPETLLVAQSLATQTPVGLDTAMQVEFGPAQSNNAMSVDVNGVITAHQVGIYQSKTTLYFTRPTSSGEAYFFVRLLRDGVQVGNAIGLTQTDDDVTVPIILDQIFPIAVADLNVPFTIEVIRDSQGIDDGELQGLTSNNGWGPTPSARIVVSRF